MLKLATGQDVFYNRTGRKSDTFHPVTVEKSARKFTAIRFADGKSELVMTCTLWPALPTWATGETKTASLTLAPSHNSFHGVNGALNGMERR